MRVRSVLLLVVVAFLAIQLVPYGHDHVNPPVRQEPPWDSPRTRALAVRACYNCHSNETVWPWYSAVAPASWLVEHDVVDGRRHVNFSEWGRPQREQEKLAKEVLEGDMPPVYYPWAHLTTAERAELARGLERLVGTAPTAAHR